MASWQHGTPSCRRRCDDGRSTRLICASHGPPFETGAGRRRPDSYLLVLSALICGVREQLYWVRNFPNCCVILPKCYHTLTRCCTLSHRRMADDRDNWLGANRIYPNVRSTLTYTEVRGSSRLAPA